MTFKQSEHEQLKNDLEEVEELTSRVRDSISMDLSNTRRYSPLLYEYYRKQLELAKSIQYTYNIQCNSLFDAMTLMRRCLRDQHSNYASSNQASCVHNPEYLTINDLDQQEDQEMAARNTAARNYENQNSLRSFSDYLNKQKLMAQNQAKKINNTQPVEVTTPTSSSSSTSTSSLSSSTSTTVNNQSSSIILNINDAQGMAILSNNQTYV
jgi:hypothetical protein